MSIYYVSNTGCDANDGLTPDFAWRTIAKVNSSISGGDEVRFRCGDTFYGKIFAKDGPDADHPTIYTSYGEGEKPVISQLKTAVPERWEQFSDTVWRLDLTDITAFTGNVTDIDTNTGFIKVDRKIYPRKKFSADELEQQWDFWNDETYIYVKSVANPASISENVAFACNIHGMDMSENLKVSGLCFRDTGAHGIRSKGVRVHISDCDFMDIGGSQLVPYPIANVRYGNGVEFWSDSHDAAVERCRFSGIYDVAITMQGNGAHNSWENMIFRDNIIWKCQQAFEIWASDSWEDFGFKNCLFENNICLDSGYGWSYDVRPDKANAVHLLINGIACPCCDIIVRGNIFYNARQATIFCGNKPEDYQVSDNTVIRPAEQKIVYSSSSKAEEYERRAVCTNRVYDISLFKGYFDNI